MYIAIIPVIIFSLFSHGLAVILISLVLGVSLKISQLRKRRIIAITASEIAITCPTRLQDSTRNDLDFRSYEKNWQLEHRFPLNKVWELEYFLPYHGSNHYLNLKVANQVWCIQGTRQEIQWLVGELSHYLGATGSPVAGSPHLGPYPNPRFKV
jgi:hypothetical protein